MNAWKIRGAQNSYFRIMDKSKTINRQNVKTDYTIVIPVLRLDGNPHLENILDSLGEQSLPPDTAIIVAGDKRQGRAINFGVSKAETTYIGTVDDDTMIDDPELFRKLVDALNAVPTIGIAGASCAIPDSASAFQKRAMREIPRRFFPVQKNTVDSDMVQHPCLLMPRELFLEIGGEDEELIRGLDPVLRKKVRDAGKRVAIIADTWVYHLIPDGLWKVVKMYYRNG
ncbi:MAG: glycosyltransferase, partial [Victivallales bacterium]|nr:glycosyltransferase [Victivallales bacterium]